MRVGYMTYGLDRNPTGIGRYAVELANALNSLSVDIDLVILSTEREDVRHLFPGCEFHRIPGAHLLPLLLTAGDAALSVMSRRLRLDLLHDPNGIAPMLSPSPGVKRLVTIHDAFAYVYPEGHNRLDNWRFHWHLPRAARKVDGVLTVSECSRRDLVRYLHVPESHLQVTAEGVDARFRPVPDSAYRRAVLNRYGVAGRYLLYVGGLNARKNIAALLSAFMRLDPSFHDVRLVIAGKRQWKLAELDRLVAALESRNRVVFTGYVDDDDLPALYSAAEAFVFPSIYEGFGLPPLEAMACGTPVIASSAASLPEVLGDSALFVDPGDVLELERAMARVLTDKTLTCGLRHSGLQHATGYTWQSTAQATYSIFQHVVSAAIANEHPAGV